MRRAGRWASVLAGLALAPGCASGPGVAVTASAKLPVEAPAASAVAFCADGAGGFGYTTEALAYTAAEERLPLHVELVPWSHGRGRMFADACDWAHAQEQGRLLAARVRAWQECRPELPVYLVGHSAGCAVVLEAAGRLPPDSLERVVLLAPSVSADYDLRPALASARRGVDAFTSRWDVVTLGLGMRLLGTADRRWSATAGRVGFRRVEKGPDDAALYARLHEHPWDAGEWSTGHHGGHYGGYEPGFLRARVLPLLTPGA
jgi:pimeloyl-ACP methyl ester carboxylesterase